MRKKLPAKFFESDVGKMPVREWILDLRSEDRQAIGDDIRVVELGWPVGMPLCRSIEGRKGLWEIRTKLPNSRIARVLFCVHQAEMMLLHGFIKKTRKTPVKEIEIAMRRMRGLK